MYGERGCEKWGEKEERGEGRRLERRVGVGRGRERGEESGCRRGEGEGRGVEGGGKKKG